MFFGCLRKRFVTVVLHNDRGIRTHCSLWMKM